MTTTPICITAEAAFDETSKPCIALKVSSQEFEVNIFISDTDLPKFNKVKDANWERGSLAIGTSARSTVYWSCDDDLISLLIGSDDQSWDIGFSFAAKYMATIMSEIKRAETEHWG